MQPATRRLEMAKQARERGRPDTSAGTGTRSREHTGRFDLSGSEPFAGMPRVSLPRFCLRALDVQAARISEHALQAPENASSAGSELRPTCP